MLSVEYLVYLICNFLFMNWVQILASMIVFQYYIHHAHWVVKGDDAYMFHLLYDRIYSSLDGIIDQYAEYLVWTGDDTEIPSSMIWLEGKSIIRPVDSETEEWTREKILRGAEALKTISQMTGRDRTENRILDDISAVATTTIYLLWQITKE